MNERVLELFEQGMPCSAIDSTLGLNPGKAHWVVVNHWKAVKSGKEQPKREPERAHIEKWEKRGDFYTRID